MLGWINRSIKEFILLKFGAEAWDAIVAKYQHDIKWQSQCPYSDSHTVDLVVVAANHLGVSVGDALEAYGDFFIPFMESLGYVNLLHVLGTNLHDFLSNLNNLHLVLHYSFPEMRSPAFSCEYLEDAANGNSRMRIVYSSVRQGLYRIVFGIVKGVAKQYFSCEVVAIEVVAERVLNNGNYEYDLVVEVKGDKRPVAAVPKPISAHAEKTLTFTHELFFKFFPFAMFINSDCQIQSVSPYLNRVAVIKELDHLSKHVEIIHPNNVEFETYSFLSHAFNRTAFVMRVKANGLELKGQFFDATSAVGTTGQISEQVLQSIIAAHQTTANATQETTAANPSKCPFKAAATTTGSSPPSLAATSTTTATSSTTTTATTTTPPPPPTSSSASSSSPSPSSTSKDTTVDPNPQAAVSSDNHTLVFICSPRVRSLQDMRQFGVFLSDVPLHDNSMDMVLLSEQRSAEAELSQRIEALNLELEIERKRSDTLLYQMLPVPVAESLRCGKKVSAQRYPSVTILFSDIVGFTVISAQSQPENVFRMLDDLYTELDTELATNFPELYKVETIGDAYMVVGNLTTPCENHADRMIQYASRMLAIAETIDSGVPGVPVQLRVGLHTGSVVAGVVGKKMPSFCLFGDTVNTASRMESNSLAGHIHISDECHKAIKDTAMFEINSRGIIEVKGKGKMNTHFVRHTSTSSSVVEVTNESDGDE